MSKAVMHDDDLTPNDSEAAGVYVPDEPEEVQQADREEAVSNAIAQPVIEELLAWFDAQESAIETVDAVQKTKDTYKVTTDEAFIAHHLIATLLHAKKKSLRSKFVNHYEGNA